MIKTLSILGVGTYNLPLYRSFKTIRIYDLRRIAKTNYINSLYYQKFGRAKIRRRYTLKSFSFNSEENIMPLLFYTKQYQNGYNGHIEDISLMQLANKNNIEF